MTQALYAHMNKKKEDVLTIHCFELQAIGLLAIE
jgi:hypothetical protein